MREITMIGVDLAKEVFQLHAVDRSGKKVFEKRLTRRKFLDFLVHSPPTLFVMEACGGAHSWARKAKSLGHDAKLISPQFVKPFVKSNKNDARDAEAICEAASRPAMRFVSIKSEATQAVQTVLRTREQFVKQKTAIKNSIHAALYEYGLTVSKSSDKFLKELNALICFENEELQPLVKRMLALQLKQYMDLDELIKNIEKEIKAATKESDTAQRLQSIPGVGIISAASLLVYGHNISEFKTSRDFSASLGLVPRQFSSGKKQVLGGISKRGDRALRCLLVHGARAVLRTIDGKEGAYFDWCRDKKERRGYNRASCAIANKNARIIWSLIKNEGQKFKAA